MRTVLAVPRRADGGVRDRLWEYCRQQWRTDHPDLDIIEGHHDDGPFNRSAAVNRAARAAGDFDCIVIIDADVLIQAAQVRAGIELATRFNRVVFPFRVYRSVSQSGTSRIMNGWTGDWRQTSIQAYWDSVSCVVIVPRALWDQVGGMDERFVGWGWEDTAFACATDAVSGRLRLDGTLWHLWHPASPERNPKTVEYRASRDLAAQYRNAAHVGWEAMLPILKQPGGPLA